MAENKQPINVAIEPEEPKDMDLTVNQIKNIADYGRRSHDKWLMNERSGSSMMLRNNGQSNLAAGKYSQYKLNPEGSSQENTLISQTITNRKILQADEFVFNNHKFNTQLIDLADFRKMKVDQNQNCVVGNFTVFGSVLVKAWEENLKRYVLIRRPARMSLFSPLLNVPDIMPASQVQSPLKSDEKLVGISDKGYQVNMIIYDHKTRIGKEGEDREGIDRTPDHSGGYIGYSGNNAGVRGSSASSSAAPANVGPAKGKGIENIPSDAEQWTIDMAKECSELCGIPADWLWCHWRAETGFVASNCPGDNNWGCVKDNNGWHNESSTSGWAKFFARYITLNTWQPNPTQAKTLHEYVQIIQEQSDGTHYCYDDGGATEPYYNKLVSCLGNQGTVLN